MSFSFPLKVAVVDDDAASRLLLNSVLQGCSDIQTVCFENPKTCLEVIKNDPFHILVSDLVMPEMRGDQLIREVTDLRQGIVSIVVTGQDTLMDSHSCFRAGAWDYIRKPIDKADVLATMERAVQHFRRWGEIFADITASKKQN